MNCIVDGHNGIYVPQIFAEGNARWREQGEAHWIYDKEDEQVLLAGPNHECYFETWDHVLETAEFSQAGAEACLHLGKSGDLFEATQEELDEMED